MNGIVTTIWVEPGQQSGAVINLVDDLNNLARADVDVREVLMIKAGEVWAKTIVEVLEAGGFRIVVENRSELVGDPAAADVYSWVKGEVDVVKPVEPVTTIVPEEVVTGKALDTTGFIACELCGVYFKPKSKRSRFCDKPKCQKERQRQYQVKSMEKKESEVMPGVVMTHEDSPYDFPYLVVDGKDANRRLDLATLEFWLKGRLTAGTIVEHYQRGRYMVIHKDGKKNLYLQKVVAA
jgi:hypothetical protein